MREFLRIDVPVSQASMICLSLSEPAIIHHKTLNSEGRSLLGESHLASFIDIEGCCLPGVVEDGTELRCGGVGENRIDFKPMQETRGSTDSVIGVSAIKVGV